MVEPIFGIDDDEYKAPTVKVQKTRVPSGYEFDNVVNVSKGALQKIKKKTDKSTRRVVDNMLMSSTPSLLAFDNASSYVQAVLRDGLGVEVDIDNSMTVIIESLTTLSMAYTYARMVRLPKSVRKLYIETLTVKLVDEAVTAMKKKNLNEKNSRHLKDIVASVGERLNSGDVSSSVGVKKSRKVKQ